MLAAASPDKPRPKRKVSRALHAIEWGTMIVRWRPEARLTPEELVRFCQDNDELRIEQTSGGEIIIMPPAYSDTGNKELEIAVDLGLWARQAGGKAFGSNAGFTLPNRAMRSPDASWISQERAHTLTPAQWHSFAPICPDFVVELRSSTDRLPKLKEKLAEYMANGARLGWLIDPAKKQVFIYRSGQPVEHLKAPATLSGEAVLPGFILNLSRVW